MMYVSQKNDLLLRGFCIFNNYWIKCMVSLCLSGMLNVLTAWIAVPQRSRLGWWRASYCLYSTKTACCTGIYIYIYILVRYSLFTTLVFMSCSYYCWIILVFSRLLQGWLKRWGLNWERKLVTLFDLKMWRIQWAFLLSVIWFHLITSTFTRW